MNSIFRLIISISIPLAVGGISGYFTSSSVDTWYAALNKPSFNPPGWLFGPVWTALYFMMGIALYLVWCNKSGADSKDLKVAMIMFFIQLGLNFLWSFIFFYAKQPGWALIEIVLMWIAIFFCIVWFGKISSAAAWLLIPYICWVSFASVLNYAIWKLN